MTETKQRERTITWEDPLIGAQVGQGLTGLDYVQKIANGEVPAPPIAVLMNFTKIEVGEGRAVFSAKPEEYHYNPIGTVHGGFAATLFDSALGCAVHTTLPQGVGYTTLELHVNYLRPITVETGEVHCEAKVIHSGRRMATAEARLIDAQGKLYGHATTTCIVIGP